MLAVCALSDVIDAAVVKQTLAIERAAIVKTAKHQLCRLQSLLTACDCIFNKCLYRQTYEWFEGLQPSYLSARYSRYLVRDLALADLIGDWKTHLEAQLLTVFLPSTKAELLVAGLPSELLKKLGLPIYLIVFWE